VIGAAGVTWCFAANTVSFLAVLACLALMRTSEMFPLARRGRPTIWRGTREGLAFARRSPRIMAILGTTSVFATLLFNFNILLPVLAKQTLHQGPAVFGLIMSAFGAGALVGALGTAAVGRASWSIAALGATAFAFSELLLAPLRSVWLVAALLFVIGIFFTVYTSNANATVQLETPDHLRGRVLGLYYYAWNGLAPLGALAVGWLLDVGGTELAFLTIGATGLAAVAAAVAYLRREQGVPLRTWPAVLPSRAR